MPTPTPQQRRAIQAEGDVLVMAGAGAGKTSTLVARILHHLLDVPRRLSLDRLLVVTFNEAAAAEMRHRLGLALEDRLRANPDDHGIAEQLALLESARVSTLHAFCLQLLREHFHELGLDPQFGVMDEVQATVLGNEVLAGILRGHYQGDAPRADLVRPFLERHARDGDLAVKELILRVHDYLRSLPEPQGWLQTQRERYAVDSASWWRESLGPGLIAWARAWCDTVARRHADDAENFAATESLAALQRLAVGDTAAPRTMLEAIRHAGDRERFKRGTLGRWREPLEDLFDEAERWLAFLGEAPVVGGATANSPLDPLEEDWQWARPDVLALLELVGQFDAKFEEARRAASLVDFADLEQFALSLLWDSKRQVPTRLAEHWRGQFDLVFVDEYQDINGAQDRLLACVSREGAAANRFFVGDVKQSIYRFRRADPRIFQRYAQQWREGPGRAVLPLTENFRSHEAILEFVNAVFAELMRIEVGGVGYDAEARLQYGAPDQRPALRANPAGRVEAHWLVADRRMGAAHEGDPDGASPGPANSVGEQGEDADLEEQQAWVAAQRLREFHEQGLTIWDARLGAERPVHWRDMVVLHPAPRPAAERWARQFQRAGIPLEARRSGFFEALEVSDLINLLRLLDNPLQDLPLIAVLRSPLVGLTLDELAIIRVAQRRGPFWEALEELVRSEQESEGEPGRAPAGHGTPPDSAPTASAPSVIVESTDVNEADVAAADRDPALRAAANSAREKGRWFRLRFERWRRLAREGSLVLCLETVLAETGYESWLRAQPRAEAQLGNVRRLVDASRQFDQFQRHGLFRFLQFLDAQADSGREIAASATAATDSVRLLSMHQSKGLEFPVVVVAGLGRTFNFRDLQAPWMLDHDYGVCPPVVPPGNRAGYPSLARWLAGERQRRDFLGEQVRLLYVAFTRAIDRLVLVGATRAARLEAWNVPGSEPTLRDLLRVREPLGWLGPMMARLTGIPDWSAHDFGRGRWLDWRLHHHANRTAPVSVATANSAESTPGSGVGCPAAASASAFVEQNPAVDPGLDGRVEEISAPLLERLRARLDWQYPWPTATREPAKTAVTALRRRWGWEADDEAAPLGAARSGLRVGAGERRGGEGAVSAEAVERGSVHHLFCELVRWEATADHALFLAEAERLRREGWLTERELGMLDLEGLWAFWHSGPGEELRAHALAGFVQRELPFTARIRVRDAVALGHPNPGGLAEDDFQVVQGVADLVVLLPEELWIVDYKTDRVGADGEGVPARTEHHRLQLRVYAFALSQIYRRPVTRRCLFFIQARRWVEVD